MHVSTQHASARPLWSWGTTVVAGAVILGALAGCSRQNFRARADKDVEAVITQKNLFPDWQVENWHVYPDTRARFADPACPDFPPFPPDDAAARLTSPNPQRPGRGGSGRYEGDGYISALEQWDALNRAEDEATEAKNKPIGTESNVPGDEPDALKMPDLGDPYMAIAGSAAGFKRVFHTDERPYRLRLDQSVELALFNSREFQDRREDLYLAALPVTLERYGFAAQAFATQELIRESTGRDHPDGAGEKWRINGEYGFNRTFATGGSLLVRLANQIVVDLSGPAPHTTVGNLGLTFIQPLLQGGGFAVTLEALTQAERTLVYAMRSYARFRKVFYVAIAGQGDYTNNPFGLQGLSANLGRGVGANLTARAVGYLPTVLRAATLANERKNVVALEQFLRLFENLKEGGDISELQVVRVEQNLIRSRTNVLTNTRNYLDNIDNFKLQLGIPATVPIELDDTPLRPVRLHIQRFDELYSQLNELERLAGKFDPAEAVGDYRGRWAKLLTQSSLVRETPFAKQYAQTAATFQRLTNDQLIQENARLREERRKRLDQRADRQLKNQPEPPTEAPILEQLDAAIDRIAFEQAMRRYESRPWLASPQSRQAGEQAQLFRQVYELGMLVAIQPRNQRLAVIRAEWPALPSLVAEGTDLLRVPLDEAYTTVARTALVNRLDLMNARAQVVDSWRAITVQANALQGVFDVRYDLDSATPRDEANGLAFGSTRTRHTVTLRVEPPFVRRAERNQYRASLIGYQRSRRNLMSFEDNIIIDARTDLRQLRQLAETYAMQQRVVELAYANVDNARSTFLAPPDPTSARGAAGEAAALTQQLLEAQSSVLQAQNDLYTNWITYQNLRMNLYLDLELLPLDARGLWNDEPSPPTADPTVGGAAPAERAPTPERLPAPVPAKP